MKVSNISFIHGESMLFYWLILLFSFVSMSAIYTMLRTGFDVCIMQIHEVYVLVAEYVYRNHAHASRHDSNHWPCDVHPSVHWRALTNTNYLTSHRNLGTERILMNTLESARTITSHKQRNAERLWNGRVPETSHFHNWCFVVKLYISFETRFHNY